MGKKKTEFTTAEMKALEKALCTLADHEADIDDALGDLAMSQQARVQTCAALRHIVDAGFVPYNKRSRTVCHARVNGSQNLCTRDTGHPGEHRCSAADVDARR